METYAPADRNDVRFEILDMEEGVLVLTIDDRGAVTDRDGFDTRSEAFDFVQTFRECQATPMEERFAPFGIEWQREQEGGW